MQKKFEDLTYADLPSHLKKAGRLQPFQVVHIDITWKQIMNSQRMAISTPDDTPREPIWKELEKLFSKNLETERVLPTFCVRAAFDLYFQVKNYPKGSEVIFTGVNIPDMVRIVKEHGLVPVPFDIDPRTMCPIEPEALAKLISPKTKVFIGAYVYGIRFDPSPYIDVCEEKGVDYIEDVAQTYQGVKGWTGDPRAKMTMFSFGLIKLATTYNGAVTVVRHDKELFEKMKAT